MLVLASASRRRRELLAQAGYAFEVQAADVDETPRAGEKAGAYVRRLAEEKAGVVFALRAAATLDAGLMVLGADTCVVCDAEILGKPVDAEDAARMLRLLSGRTHRVLTGVAVATQAGVSSHVEETEVIFAAIDDAEIARYCATSEPLDKAGAYGIQGYAARWIPRIDGCYFNVMGLPIACVVGMIAEASRGELILKEDRATAEAVPSSRLKPAANGLKVMSSRGRVITSEMVKAAQDDEVG